MSLAANECPCGAPGSAVCKVHGAVASRAAAWELSRSVCSARVRRGGEGTLKRDSGGLRTA